MDTRPDLSAASWRDEEGTSTRATFVGWLDPSHASAAPGSPELATRLADATLGWVPGASVRNVVRGVDPCPVCGAQVIVGAGG